MMLGAAMTLKLTQWIFIAAVIGIACVGIGKIVKRIFR